MDERFVSPGCTCGFYTAGICRHGTLPAAHVSDFEKRSQRLRELAPQLEWPDNVWMGVSVEDARVVHRIKDLQTVPAAVRFLSVEPLIGPIDDLPLEGIHWVIVGGESGPGARPLQREWVESIYHQCRNAEVAFFFKQWGGAQKKKAGRELHGQTYDEMPRLGNVPRVLMAEAGAP